MAPQEWPRDDRADVRWGLHQGIQVPAWGQGVDVVGLARRRESGGSETYAHLDTVVRGGGVSKARGVGCFKIRGTGIGIEA